jgi:DNA replication protein DnaC
LTIAKGATSFEDLQIVDGVPCHTFKAACLARGLLEDDNEWIQSLQDAVTIRTGSQLRQLFAIILKHCQPTDPADLWNQFKPHLCDDLQYRLQHSHQQQFHNPSEEQVYDYGLYLLDQLLQSHGQSLRDYPEMPRYQHIWAALSANPLIAEQRNYDLEVLQAQVQEQEHSFNPEQREAFNAVVSSCDNNQGKVFFLYSEGGGGKTYVSNAIAAKVRSQGK